MGINNSNPMTIVKVKNVLYSDFVVEESIYEKQVEKNSTTLWLWSTSATPNNQL